MGLREGYSDSEAIASFLESILLKSLLQDLRNWHKRSLNFSTSVLSK
ncbi:hypothetical protein [Nostoc sp.]